ncbi:hypothetical protein Tco_0720453 [Tanacetum coccineum]
MHHLSYRAIHNARFSILDKVADLILDNAWSWPTDWNTRYPPLANINVPQLNEASILFAFEDADCGNSVEQVQCNSDIVRLKLGTIKFKRNARVTTWNLPAD